MLAERISDRVHAIASPGQVMAHRPLQTSDLIQAIPRIRATVALVVARPNSALRLGRSERPGNAGGRRKAANRRDLPKMWVFLIRGRLCSRWKRSAESNTHDATNKPRFPGLKARREECPPTVPDNEPACCRAWLAPSAGGPGTGSHPRPPPRPAESAPGAVGPPSNRATARAIGVGAQWNSNGSSRHEESVHYRSGRQDL